VLFVSATVILIKIIDVNVNFISVQYSSFCRIQFRTDCGVLLKTLHEFKMTFYFLLAALFYYVYFIEMK